MSGGKPLYLARPTPTDHLNIEINLLEILEESNIPELLEPIKAENILKLVLWRVF